MFLPDKHLQRPSNTFSILAVVQSLGCVWLFVTPWTAAHQAILSFSISRSLLKLMSSELVMPSNHLISVLFSSCLQSSPASGSFPVSWLCIRWPKYCNMGRFCLFGSTGSSLLCGSFFSCTGQASHYGGFSCCRAQCLECVGFSGCSTWDQ